MAAFDHVFNLLPKLPLKYNLYIPKPLFYPKNSNSIIISTNFNDINPGVFKYNLDNNNLEPLLKYGNNTPGNCAQFIDYNNDTLHILYFDEYITIDLNTETIYDNNTHAIYIGDCPKTVQISSTKGDEIHIIRDLKLHFKYDCKNKVFRYIYATNDKLNDVFAPKLLYVETKKQMMILGGNRNGNIYYCNIKEPYEWKLMNNIMPHIVQSAWHYDALVFGDIIMVFYFDNKEDLYDIWCMDLLYYKWYKSKYNVPKSIVNGSFVLKSNGNNNIHLLDFENQLHFTANIHDLFSNEMIKQRRKHYEILVIGFVKDQEKNMILNIPWAIKQLVLLFYPLFG